MKKRKFDFVKFLFFPINLPMLFLHWFWEFFHFKISNRILSFFRAYEKFWDDFDKRRR